MKVFFFSFLLTFTQTVLHAQAWEAEIARSSWFNDLTGAVIGDSVFLRFRDSQESRTYHNYFILPGGTVMPADLSQLDQHYPSAIIDYGEELYFYYFGTRDGSVTLNALILNKTTGEKTTAHHTLGLQGRIIGTFNDNGLNIVFASGKEKKIHVQNIHRMDFKNEMTFSIAGDLIKGKKADLAFIDQDQRVDPRQALASRKLFREGHRLILVIDEPPSQEPEVPAKTTVIAMDLSTGKSSIRLFFGEGFLQYNSWYRSDNIYRIVLPPNKTRVEVSSLIETKQYVNKELFAKGTFEQDSFYIRKGSNNRIFVKSNRYLMKPTYVHVQSNGERNIMTLGYRPPANVPVVGSLGLGVALVSLIGSAIIRETVDGPEEYQFAHYEDPVTAGDVVKLSDSGLISEKIDRYELGQRAKDIDYHIKGYVGNTSVIYALYHVKKENRLRILKFERDTGNVVE